MTQPNPTAGSRPIVIAEIEQFGGAERSLLALARWLHQRNLPAHIVTYLDHCNLAGYATFPLTVVELMPHGNKSVRDKIAALRSHFKARPPESPKPLLSGYQPALHATLAGLRGFHTLMHDTPSLFGDQDTRNARARLRIAVSNKIIGHGLRSGGVTFVNSEFLRTECRRDFGIEARIVRMGGLTASDPVSLFRVRPVEGQLRMLSVCRIDANKRIDWIIRALATLEQNEPALSTRIDWRLDLAGQGPIIDPLTALARSLGIADRVHFHGFVPDDELQRLYSQAHLFLMTAVQGYGIPAIESIARGVPVLLHRDSGVSDILLDTPWATVFTGGEQEMPASLSSAIEGVLEGRHHTIPPPHLPTEDEWAAEVAHLCHWLP
jgi:glycosyltransferase involved in cell wall biosynthesis